MINAFRRHPANTMVKILLVLSLIIYGAIAGYRQGVAHAIQTAQVWSEDGVYLIDFDGQVHVYEP